MDRSGGSPRTWSVVGVVGPGINVFGPTLISRWNCPLIHNRHAVLAFLIHFSLLHSSKSENKITFVTQTCFGWLRYKKIVADMFHKIAELRAPQTRHLVVDNLFVIDNQMLSTTKQHSLWDRLWTTKCENFTLSTASSFLSEKGKLRSCRQLKV